MDINTYIEKESRYHMHTYSRLPVVFVRGSGCRLWDVEGKEYLDFVSGLGMSSIGHCHPAVVKAVQSQIEELIHVSNLYYTRPQIELAEKLVGASFGDKCFFANSGAEANEGVIKLVRKYAKQNLGEGKYETVTAYRSFHGRTMKMLAATGQPEKQKPFEPLPPGFVHVPLNDLGALKEAITERTCAVMLEPIQGEGGVYPCELDYLRGVRQICDEKGLLLILDEVQTGLGRTGKMFAYEHYGIEPDVMSLAKGLGGGLPIGTFIAKEEIARAFEPGDHGSTFGGGPVVCSAALAALRVLDEEGLVENCARVGDYFKRKLEKLGRQGSMVREVRGFGLMLGIELEQGVAKDIVSRALPKGVIINNIGANILRFLPPLCITEREVDVVIEVLGELLNEFD
ncbi:MAG: acetylornithine transaminase [Actinomycetota bacterium]|nr:acetylornithine transaminase [Actinomycetota bacterium]